VEHFWEQVIDDAQQRCSQISRDLLRPVTAREHYLEEPGRRYEVAALGHVHVDDLAVLVNGAVHVPPDTGNSDVGLIDEPAITDTVPARPSRVDDQRGETLHPPINRHVINVDAAFREKLFDISVRQAVAEVPPDGQQDHVRRKPKSSERNRNRTATTDHPRTLRPAPDPSTQQCPATSVVALSSPQVTALLIAVACAGADAPYSDDARAGADLLLESLASSTRANVVELRNRIRGPIGQATVSTRIRRTVQESVRRGRVLNISYLDAESKLTKRSVEAVGFYHGSDGWYLNGWCELRNAGRIFRLDRIQSARLTKRPIQHRNVDEVLGWTPQEVVAP
jgi:hypothetical protein